MASLSKAHQATAHARAANLRELAAMVDAGVPRRAAMEAVSAQCRIPRNTLYGHLRLIRMVPEPDWPAALAPQSNKGALTRLADKAFDRRRIRGSPCQQGHDQGHRGGPDDRAGWHPAIHRL